MAFGDGSADVNEPWRKLCSLTLSLQFEQL
jgi:hypothetical protein